MLNTNLHSFLKFGYFLDFCNKKFDFKFLTRNNSKDYKKMDTIELIDNGKKILIESINKRFDINKDHLVPISGGLDSRIILGLLLEFTPAKNIKTFTFGAPGSYDYNIGNRIAKKLGTSHNSINLKQIKYNINDLIFTSKKFKYQTNLFYHPNISELISLYGGMDYWSGFMGDPLAGSHLHEFESLNETDAKNRFINKNTFVKSINLSNIKNEELFKHIKVNKNNSTLTIDENIDFNNRQLKYIAPHVLFEGFNYITPFLDTDWTNFILSVDNTKHRKNTNLYFKILLSLYPSLFKEPTKNMHNLPLDANNFYVFLKKLLFKSSSMINRFYPFLNNPYLNYLDFDYEIRAQEDLKKLIYSLLMDLQKRKIIDWLNIEKIWKNHLNNYANHADALITLASLEVNLKAGKKI